MAASHGQLAALGIGGIVIDAGGLPTSVDLRGMHPPTLVAPPVGPRMPHAPPPLPGHATAPGLVMPAA